MNTSNIISSQNPTPIPQISIINPNQPIVSFQIEVIPKKEYDLLLTENKELKRREQELTEIINSRNEHICEQTQQILHYITENDRLKQENEILKERINELEKQVSELKHEITELKYEITELKNDNVLLKNDNIQLKNEKIMSKMMIVIQDLNANDSLENTIGNYANRNRLRKLRKSRNGECHFIMNGNDPDEIVFKKYVIKRVFELLPQTLIQEFETKKRMNGLISELVNYLQPFQNISLYPNKEDDEDYKMDILDFFGEDIITMGDI